MSINLKDKSVRTTKPSQANTTKAEICKLPRGQGFTLEELAEKLGVGKDTLRERAKEVDALRYVEVNPHDWQPLVMNPETAKELDKKSDG